MRCTRQPFRVELYFVINALSVLNRHDEEQNRMKRKRLQLQQAIRRMDRYGEWILKKICNDFLHERVGWSKSDNCICARSMLTSVGTLTNFNYDYDPH